MKNLLNSTDIATLFLDKELNIRRYTFQATKIFKLIKSDIGRPFTDLVSDLIYPGLSDDALEVLKTLIFIQKPIPTKDGRWFSIRIMPYRTLDDRIDGLVITFINISDLKQVEVKLLEAEQTSGLLINSSPDIIIRLSPDGKILEFNPEAEKYFGIKRENAVNRNYLKMFISERLQKKTEKDMKKLLVGLQDGNLKMEVIIAGSKSRVVNCNVNVLLNTIKMPTGMILSIKK
jgi:two-component system CheB/CheR fusion protein